MPVRKWICLIAFIGFGCSARTKLSVYNQPINNKYYSSVHAETPSPKVDRGEVGQRLIISWDIPYRDFRKHQWTTRLIVQFGNRTEETFTKEIEEFEGDWILKYSGRPYIDKRGIVSYKAELLQDGRTVDLFQHQLWCELIQLED